MQKYKLQKYRNTNDRNAVVQITEVQKYKLKDYRNTSKNLELRVNMNG